MGIQDLKDRKKAMSLGSFMGDAFALGAHWTYDLSKIEDNFGTYDQPHAPLPGSLHINKKLGDYTHYGDQALLINDYLRQNRGQYATDGFRSAWQKMMADYQGYVDSASRQSLLSFNLGDSFGSHSDELGGAARLAPVFFWIDDPDTAMAAALDQSRLTHNSPESIMATELFARIILSNLAGRDGSLTEQILQAAGKMGRDDRNMDAFDRYLSQSSSMIGHSAAEIASGLGQSCHARHAIPVILTILMTTDDYRQAMQLNAQIGGDSAARGMIAGAILGARSGLSAIPTEWLAIIRRKPDLTDLV